jgi:hypothetical protein
LSVRRTRDAFALKVQDKFISAFSAQAIAALIMVPIVVKEGIEGVQGKHAMMRRK